MFRPSPVCRAESQREKHTAMFNVILQVAGQSFKDKGNKVTDEEYFYDVVPDIYEEYTSAIKKHPIFPTPGKSCEGIVMEELGEIVQAYNNGAYRHMLTEIDHTFVTLVRWRKKIEEVYNVQT